MVTDKRIDIDGTTIRYRDTGGDGPPVLAIHGIGESLELWQPQLDGLAGQLRLVALDLPGHGESDLGDQPYDPDSFAELVWRFVDGLGIVRLYLVGNSLGAAIAIRMADSAAQRVTGVLAADSASLGPEVFLPFRLTTLPLLGEAVTRLGKRGVDRMIDAIVADRSVVDDDLRAALVRNTSRADCRKPFLDTLRRMVSVRGQRPEMWQRTRDILAELSVPVLLVHGRDDVVVPVSHSELAHRLAPESELVVLDGCGHTPQIELPERFNKLLVAAVER